MTGVVELAAAFGSMLVVPSLAYYLKRQLRKRSSNRKSQELGQCNHGYTTSGRPRPGPCGVCEGGPYRKSEVPSVLVDHPVIEVASSIRDERDKYEHALAAISSLQSNNETAARRIATDTRNETAPGGDAQLTRNRFLHALEAILLLDDCDVSKRIAKQAISGNRVERGNARLGFIG